MADVTRLVRSKNAHELRNFVFGHFGTTLYDEAKQEWSCLRQANEDEGVPSLSWNLLHTNIIPGSEQIGTAVSSSHRTTPFARLDRISKASVTDTNLGNLNHDDTAYDSATPIRQVKPVFCYVLSPYEQGGHRRILPVLLTLPKAGSATMSVRRIRTINILDLQEGVPILDRDSNSIIDAPLHEPILGLSCSEDQTILAIRQRSATSICNLVLSTSSLDISRHNLIMIENVLSIPTSRTGGHPHRCVAFHPTSSSATAIIDEHGNWSVWRRTGRRKQSSRILSLLRLQVSGKLLPHKDGLVPQANRFFDGWHRICWLSNAESGSQTLLVCSRRVARMFDLDGTSRGDVDMRLGTRAADNRILDMQPSLLHKSICYVLTTTRVMAMRLAGAEGGAETLNLLCSWTHFCNGRGLDLTISLLELPNVRCVLLTNTGKHPMLFWMRPSPVHGLVSLGDPADLVLPQSMEHILKSSTATLQLVDAEAARKRSHVSEVRILTKLVAIESSGNLTDYTFSVGSSNLEDLDAAQPGPNSLRIARDRDWHIRSSRFVDEDDDLVDLVVPDGANDHSRLSQQPGIFNNASRLPSRTRNWQDLLTFQSQTVDLGDAGESLAVLEAQAGTLLNEQETVHSVADLVNEFRVTDIEQLSKEVHGWHQRCVGSSRAHLRKHFRSTVGTTPPGMDSAYRSLMDRFSEPLSQDVPDRARVQTERISRQTAFDVYASGIVLLKPQAHDIAPVESQQISASITADQELWPPNSEDEVFAKLRLYTMLNTPSEKKGSGTTLSRILAHLPSDLDDPAAYSYSKTEARIQEEQSQQAFSQLSDSERRLAERSNLRKEKKMAQQLRQREEAELRNLNIPGLSMFSQLADPREVQSSQVVPTLASSHQVPIPMTQPERGAHGERRKSVKKAGRRTKGF